MNTEATEDIRLLLRQLAFGLEAGVLGAADNRMAVWTFGCNLSCPGCSSSHTWRKSSAADAHWVSVKTLLRLALERDVQGIVISGGEPTLQAPAATALAKGFKARFPEMEVVLYSGMLFEPLHARFTELVEAVDVVVAGPYDQSLPPTPLAGSSNQEVVLRTPVAERLFSGWESWPLHRMQIASQIADSGDTEIVTVGIPHNQRLAKALQDVKHQVHQVSWLPGGIQQPQKQTSKEQA